MWATVPTPSAPMLSIWGDVGRNVIGSRFGGHQRLHHGMDHGDGNGYPLLLQQRNGGIALLLSRELHYKTFVEVRIQRPGLREHTVRGFGGDLKEQGQVPRIGQHFIIPHQGGHITVRLCQNVGIGGDAVDGIELHDALYIVHIGNIHIKFHYIQGLLCRN